MPDITEQLGALLSDPEGMERIKSMAQSLLGGASPQNQKSDEPDSPDMSSLIKAASMLKSRPDDNRVQLLMALRPHLKPERQSRVDRAIKMLRLLDMAPMLTKLGLFDM